MRISVIEDLTLQPLKMKDLQKEASVVGLTPTARLLQFIQERITRLSKHDIDHAPIIKHIPVPAMAPPLRSQEQMKDALEEIWRTANMDNRFRRTWCSWLLMLCFKLTLAPALEPALS